VILGSGRHLSLYSDTHPETLQINSAIGSFVGLSPDAGAACDSGVLPAIPCLMILICVFLPVRKWSTSIRLLRLGNLSCAYHVSCLNIPEVSTRWVRASEKGIRQIAMTGGKSLSSGIWPHTTWPLDTYLNAKYLDIKVTRMRVNKLESLTGGSGVHVFLVLWKAAHAAQAYAEKSILKLELCGSDFAVLEALLHKGPLPVNEIGKKVLLTSGSITSAVDRLETKGLVERRAHGTDRRARIVHLTKQGRKLITRAYADHAADMEELASASLSKEERKTLIQLLKKIGYEAAGTLEQSEEKSTE
jgi:MarR family 2-MHQ and catechol resistance regulon transcriptional repressor